MAVVALYNLKGGVGKTTGAVNLAHLASRLGRRTLVWDLDGQGAATFLLGREPAGHRALDALVDGSRPLDDLVVTTAYEGLSLVPASPSYLDLDVALDATRKPARRLARLLEPLADQYDDVFLDCPPSMSTLSASIVRAADVVLVPLLPSPLAVRAFDQLSRFVAGTKHRPQVWAYFSMVDGRRRLHRELTERLPGVWPGILGARIPAASDIERMGVHRAPLVVFAPASRAATAFEALASELRGRFAAEPVAAMRR